MIKVTITPKDGKPVVKSFRTPQESIEFINSFTSRNVSRPTKRALDLAITCEKCGALAKYPVCECGNPIPRPPNQ